VILAAEEDILKSRFIASYKERTPERFKNVWADWVAYERPNWIKCADVFFDTTRYTDLNLDQLIIALYTKVVELHERPSKDS
jgi:hypothetical protein